MLSYIALWLVTASAAYPALRWSNKKQFTTWTNSDMIFFAAICLIFGPIALIVSLGWAGLMLITKWQGLSNWLNRPSKW